MNARELYSRFLGLNLADPSPGELLGLGADQPTDEAAIRAALTKRLAQVDAHAQARTPDADQVRMALHAAAAVLSDALLRDAVAHRSVEQALPRETPTPPTATVSPPPSAPAAQRTPASPEPAPTSRHVALTPLEAAIVGVLAGSGGWTSRSQQQLGALALQWGLTAEELIERVRALAARWAVTQEATGQEDTVDEDAPLLPRRRWGARLAVLLALVVGVFAVVLSLTAVLTQPGRGRPRPTLDFPDAPRAAPTSQDPQRAADAGDEPSPTPPAAPTERTPAELALEAKRIGREIIAAGGSLAEPTRGRLEAWIRDAGGRWTTLGTRDLESVNAAGIEALQAAGDVEAAARSTAQLLVEAVVAEEERSLDPVTLTQRSYIGGLLAAVASDQRTSRALRLAVQEAVGAWPVLPADQFTPQPQQRAFAQGALAALRYDLPRLAEARTTDQDATGSWTAWRAGIAASHRLLDASPEGDYLAATELLLLHAPESLDQTDAFTGLLRRFINMIDFADPQAQGAVVQWLLDPRIRTRDLHTVTSAIVKLELAAGLDDGHILAADAPPHERTRLTRRWSQGALAEGQGAADSTAAAGSTFSIDADERAEWLRRTDLELSQPIEGISAVNTLRRAVRYARLRAAAAQIARGELEAARDRLLHIRIDFAVQPPPKEPPARSDGELTAALAMPGLTDARKIDLIRSFAERQPIIGPADARTLATLALAESSLPIRDTAQERIRWDYGDSPHLVLALLDLTAGTRVIRTTGLAETVERITGQRLPEPQDADFLPALRLALTNHLLELRESAYAGHAVDELAHHLAAAYQAASGGNGNVEAPEIEAQRLLDEWRRLGERRGATLPGDVDSSASSRRLAASLSLASGPLQRFVALQRALLEEMAAVVLAEAPAGREAILTLLDATHRRLLEAQGALGQMEVLERAMLEVMRQRFLAATPLETPAP